MIILQARKLGEVAPGWNPDVLVDMVFGAMWYRLLIGHAALDERFADELSEAVLAMVRKSP